MRVINANFKKFALFRQCNDRYLQGESSLLLSVFPFYVIRHRVLFLDLVILVCEKRRFLLKLLLIKRQIMVN